MAMTGSGLAAARKTAIGAVPAPASGAAAAAAFADALRVADSDAIVAYIQQNMLVTSSGIDPQGGTVTTTSSVIA